jgi:hypothetical protein
MSAIPQERGEFFAGIIRGSETVRRFLSTVKVYSDL